MADHRVLTRDCDVMLIPSGEPGKLPAGSQIRVMQKLGGNYTILTERGQMGRIAGADGDALGEVVPETSLAASFVPETTDEKAVDKALRTVYDPEIPVNIVDLGLIYGTSLEALPSGGSRVAVQMTLTAPGCAMSDVIKQEVETKLRALPGVEEVAIALTFDPPWSRDRMTEAARLELGML